MSRVSTESTRPAGRAAATVLPTLAEDLAGRIQDLIVRGDFAVGSRIPAERELALRFGTSRPTISQALRSLSLMGLLEIRRGSGAYVLRRPQGAVTASLQMTREMDASSLRELLQFRLWLEMRAVTTAASREPPLDEKEVAGLRTALDRLHAAHTPSEWVSADTVFHSMVVAAATNPWLTAVYDSVHTTAVAFQFQHWVVEESVPVWLARPEAGIAEIHQMIFDAVVHRLVDDACVAVEQHHRLLVNHMQYPPDRAAPNPP